MDSEAQRSKFNHLNSIERKTAFALAAVTGSRMFALFMIFPVLSLYIGVLDGADERTVGLALGAFGLMQALLQIPFGIMSDRYGRKPLILIGLILFFAGSLIAATSDSIWGVIFGRVVQGAGAVSGVVMALAADLTREEVRTRALAIIGGAIGLSVILAFAVGPLLDSLIGLTGIFWVMAVMAVLGVIVVVFVVPNPQHQFVHSDTETIPKAIGSILVDKQLLRFNLGIFLLHASFAAAFLVFPVILLKLVLIENKMLHGGVYFVALMMSLIIMIPLMISAERHKRMRAIFVLSIGLLIATNLAFMQLTGVLQQSYSHFVAIFLSVVLILFFSAFNFLESALPSLISRTSPMDRKGTAMGVYSTFQYLGTFVGAVVGGILFKYFSFRGVFLYCSFVLIIWLPIAFGMQSPRYLRTQMLKVGKLSATDAKQLEVQLAALVGVAEVLVVVDEGIAYLKVDPKELDQQALFAFSINTEDTDTAK